MPARWSLGKALPLLIRISLAVASSNSTSPSSQDCVSLAALLAAQVYFPGNSTYTSEQTSYYSTLETELTPTCIVQPNNAQDVATIINYLRTSPHAGDTLVAIRSGGHTPWAGAANIQDGVTIDMSRLNATTLSPDKTTASVGVGARWGSVYSTLAADGLAIMGGRVSTVGVGGLVLGGGLSFFSDEKGWVCDSVINYEIVLSSGAIIQANATSYPDLFVTLKGGNNNFGIVTRFDFPTFAQGQMYGGGITYNASALDSVYQEFTQFTADPNGDEKASIAATIAFTVDTGLIVHMDMWHTTSENSSSLAPLIAVQPQLENTLHVDSLTNFAEVQAASIGEGGRQGWYTTSIKPDYQLLIDIHSLFEETVTTLQNEPGIEVGFELSPVRQSFVEASLARRHNMLGSGVSDGPYIICLLGTAYSSPASDSKVAAAMLSLIDQIDELAASRGLGLAFKYLNYADGAQDKQVLEGYGVSNVADMKAASLKYDLVQFFQKNVPGGYKL